MAVRKGANSYFVANLVSQVFALSRFALLARLLGAEQLGLAAMLILTSQFFVAVSDTGSDRFMIQDRDGGEPKMQATIHLVLAIRGALIALALVVFSGLAAQLFHEPDLKPYLVGLAIGPLIAGFIHLDFRRVQRESDFRPESLGILLSETLSMVATVVAALVTRNASAVVWGLVARSIVLVIVSHMTATRPYRWTLARPEGLRFSRFAAPLFLNGLLLFFGSQGDRVVIANGMGAEALGHYSAVLLLIFYPTTMLTRLVVGFFLPLVSRARDDPEKYAFERDRLGGRMTVLSIAILVGFTALAPIATPLLYGKSFIEPLQFFGLIGALQTARFLRSWPTTIANSVGRSTIILTNNIARLAGVGLAIWVNAYVHSAEAVVIAFFLGEMAALVTALWQLDRAGAVQFRREFERASLFFLWTIAVSGLAWALQLRNLIGIGTASAALVVATLLLASERKIIADSYALLRRRLASLARRRSEV